MAIEQHPIPQDVAGYRFRLIGEMTLKQFIWLALGIILCLTVYSIPLPFFFRYPLSAIFLLLGAGIAFVPVQGRPLDKWLIAFIKSVYSPTQYVWSKQNDQAVITSASPAKTPPPVSSPIVIQKPITVPNSPPAVSVSIPVTPTPVIKPEPPTPPTPTPPAPHNPAPDLPIPFTPTSPNTLVGMTLDQEGRILSGCLIEIKTRGLSVRATKSNQLGQFLFAKPLENGTYQIYTEKVGYDFEVYALDLRGQIIKPLKLQAKASNI